MTNKAEKRARLAKAVAEWLAHAIPRNPGDEFDEADIRLEMCLILEGVITPGSDVYFEANEEGTGLLALLPYVRIEIDQNGNTIEGGY